MSRLRILTAATVLLTFLSTNAQADDFFEKKVRPLLAAKCYPCHGGNKTSGGLSLEHQDGWAKGGASGPAIIPGDVDSSLLIDAIHYRGLEMPPSDKGGKLKNEEIEILTTWVKNGAKDPRVPGQPRAGTTKEDARTWWSYQPLLTTQATDSPVVIDQFIQSALQKQGLTAQTRASRRDLIRRATFDLTGLPPTYQQVTDFEQDESPDAFLEVINRLMDSPEYGEHWGRHWLDVVRYADTAGENSDRPLPHAWRYRNWVIDSFNRDLPFTSFVQQQLSGDLQPLGDSADAGNNGIIATGYLAVARRYGHNINHDIHLMHEDVIDNVGKAFLGMTIGCARCHDHKYDPVSSADYYALYGIFNSTRFSFPGCEAVPQPSDLIDLMPTGKAEELRKAHAEAMAKFEANQPNRPETIEHLKGIASKSFEILATVNIGEGGNESIADHLGENTIRHIQRGEVIQLAILRNGNYGADTTGLELSLQNTADDQKQWSSGELVELMDAPSCLIKIRGAFWALLDVTNGPKYLIEKKRDIGGQTALKGWALGDNPSVFANTGNTPVAAWTKLPPKTLFSHPGPAEDVAIAWICPEDGEYRISGHVLDAHPAGADGVSFRLEHFKNPDYGDQLAEFGSANGDLSPPPKLDIPVAYAVTEGEVNDAALQLRGDPEQAGELVPRRWLDAFGGHRLQNPEQSGRLELAQWTTSHPLFARVLANRVWHWHFAQGIVSTPNDFGSRGAPPSHPELLEYLSSQLVAHNYQLKPLHRLIMLSDVYQRSSGSSKVAQDQDPTNRWLSHFSPRRLSAEEIRDSLLVMSGELDSESGQQHPFPPEATWTFSQHAPFHAVYQTAKRSVYMMVQRQRRHPFLALFDGPDPNASTPVRDQTTVPTQALYFLNDDFFHSCANQTASRASANDPADPAIDALYQLLFQRPATDAETSVALRFLGNYPGTDKERWQAISRVLMSSNEFLYVD